MKFNRGQVWIETVLYTLITLALIGVVLALVSPKINESKDRLVVDQTINSLGVLDGKITNVIDGGVGNVRTVEFTMKRGKLIINSSSDEIIYEFSDLVAPYSEDGVEIQNGRILIVSNKLPKGASLRLRIPYSPINITYSGSDGIKEFGAAQIPYKFKITNAVEGNINIEEVSGR